MAGIGYAFISAYLKGEEAKMIASDHLGDITRASTVQEVVDTIRETDIGSYLEGLDIRTFDELDEHLWNYFGGCLNRLVFFKNVPAGMRRILKAYTVKYDILNTKTALQNILSTKITNCIPAGSIYDNGLLDELTGAEDMDGIIGILNACKLGSYASVLEEYRLEEGIKPEVLTDTKMEGIYYRELLDAAGHTKDSAALLRAFHAIIDMTNLQIILRAVISETGSEATEYTIDGGYELDESTIGDLISSRLTDIPSKLDNSDYRSTVEEIIADYEKNMNIAAIDETIDKHKFRLVREILSPRVMSPSVVIWYLVLKEIEIRNLRLIMKAVLDNMQPDEIKDYLVLSS